MICKFSTYELTQKELYYKIQNVFNLENQSTEKYAGIYIIVKNNYPVYVGQSKNLASRIATHLKGKYETADGFLVLDIRDLGWTDFHDRSSISKTNILNNAEKYIIKELKPTENIMVDFDFNIPEEQTPNFEYDDMQPRFHISKAEHKYSISISSEDDSFSAILDTCDMMTTINRFDACNIEVNYKVAEGVIKEFCDKSPFSKLNFAEKNTEETIEADRLNS